LSYNLYNNSSSAFVATVPVIVSPSVDHTYSSAERELTPYVIQEPTITNSSTYNQGVIELKKELQDCGSDDDGVKGAEALLDLAFRNKRRESSEIIQVKKIRVIRN